MAGQDLNALKGHLREYVESITQRSKGGLYVCPLCGSGKGAHRTGAFSVHPDGLHWRCFGCEEGGDIYDLVSRYENISATDATKRVIGLYGSASTEQSGGSRVYADLGKLHSSSAPAVAAPAEIGTVDTIMQPQTDYSEYLTQCAKAIPGSKGESYLRGRGLTDETIKRFNLGYDPALDMVTIPYNTRGSYYGKRSVNPNAGQKHDNLQGVPMPLFNTAALYSAPMVFIVESPLCAISIEQAGGAAVAISGTSGANKLCKQLETKPSGAVLILCLDNDKQGKKAQYGSDQNGEPYTAEDDDIAKHKPGLCDKLKKIGVKIVDGIEWIMGEESDPASPNYRKDPNEVLQRSGADALREAVTGCIDAVTDWIQNRAQEEARERQQRTGAEMINAFLQDVQSERYKPIPTGIRDIDYALHGGFARQTLISLGAAPGAGKTGLAQWIFEGMAARGETTCLFINLEMSRNQIIARSLSRMTAARGVKVNAARIMQGYTWTDEERKAITETAQEYSRTIAPYMIYNREEESADLNSILEYCEGEAVRAEAAQMPAPMVVLDYLQLLTGDPREDSAAVIKRAVQGFKSFAIKHNTVVFMIIAHNRQSNSSGNVGMESGRDTSAIEYSADVQLALTFTGCLDRDGQKGQKPDDLTEEQKRSVTLRIVKGRFGGRGTDVDLIFDGDTMTYTQVAHDFTEYKGKTPFSAHDQGKSRVRL